MSKPTKKKFAVLTKKLTFHTVLTGLLITLVLSTYQLIRSYEQQVTLTKEQLNTTANTFSAALAASLWNLDFEQAEILARDLVALPYVDQATISVDGFKDIKPFTKNFDEEQDLLTVSLALYQPTPKGQQHVGQLRLSKELISLQHAAQQSFLSTFFNNLLLVSALCFIMMLIYERIVTRRLRRLSHAMDVLEPGKMLYADLQLDKQAKSARPDEIDELYSTVDELWKNGNQAFRDMLDADARWRFALSSTGQGLWDWQYQTGDVFYSDEWKAMLGYLPEEVPNEINQWADRVHPDDIQRCYDDIKNHVEKQTEFYVNTHRMRHKDGRYIWLLARGKVIERDANDQPLRIIGTITDLTEIKKTEEQLRIASTVFNQASEGMMMTDESGYIIDVNKSFTKITGYAKEEVLGKKPAMLAYTNHSAEFFRTMWKTIQQEGEWHGEVSIKHKQGKVCVEWLSVTAIHNEQGEVLSYVGIYTDITERKRQEDLIKHQANYDVLTDLPNRRLFTELLKQEIKASRRDRNGFCLFLMDLDYFKEVNDSMGHDLGDKLLIEVGKRLKAKLRDSDTVARIGGDEFAAILPKLDSPVAIDKVAQSILAAMQEPFEIEGHQTFTSISIGIVKFPEDGKLDSDLLKMADQTLYKAKSQGRNQHVFYTTELQQMLEDKLTLTQQMRDAFAANQFSVRYQPIVRMSDQHPIKAEALLRWQQRDGSFVGPDKFIPIAEETGMIERLGELVVRDVIENLHKWRQYKTCEMQVSVNVSPVQFMAIQGDEPSWLKLMKDSSLPNRALVVEITEGVLMKSNPHIDAQLLNFRDYGIEVAIDDFGTGYSSLSYLHKFDIDYLKIDQSFVTGLPEDANSVAICEAIIEMAHKLNLMVIAEGVETEAQYLKLKEIGCDYGQGYWFAEPMTAEDMTIMLDCAKRHAEAEQCEVDEQQDQD